MDSVFYDARDKFRKGDRISNEELDCLYFYYKNVYESVSAKPEPLYTLVWQDASRKVEALERMRTARKQK